jgi:heme/flavin dehydrogenase (mycofactocin system)
VPGGDRFATVAEAERRARRRLPPSVYRALVAGSERGLTARDNIAAFAEIGFRPRVAGSPGTREQATRVLGRDVAFPVIISPTGVQAVHPDAEVAVARAAAVAGTAMSLSCFGSRPIEDVVAANPATFFQLHWIGGRDRVWECVERVRRAGAAGLILTLDWSFATRRDADSPYLPERLDLPAVVRFTPELVRRPGYLLRWVRTGGPPALTAPNLGYPAPTFFGAYREWQRSPLPTWADIAWLAELWGGEFLVKGVMRPDDARRAADAGATAVSVSNHGGNNLDGTPAAVRALPGVVDAVGDRVEVLLDGGIRRGSDVVTALALGARAVMIGRAALWGLAADGERGVATVLRILRSGIDETLLALGRRSVHDLGPADLLVPAGFNR